MCVCVSEPSSYDEQRNGGMSYSPAGGHRSAPQSFQLCGGKKEESQTLTKAMMQSPEDKNFKKDLIILRIWTSLEYQPLRESAPRSFQLDLFQVFVPAAKTHKTCPNPLTQHKMLRHNQSVRNIKFKGPTLC